MALFRNRTTYRLNAGTNAVHKVRSITIGEETVTESIEGIPISVASARELQLALAQTEPGDYDFTGLSLGAEEALQGMILECVDEGRYRLRASVWGAAMYSSMIASVRTHSLAYLASAIGTALSGWRWAANEGQAASASQVCSRLASEEVRLSFGGVPMDLSSYREVS